MSKLLAFPAFDRDVSQCFIDGTMLHWRTSVSGLAEEMDPEWSIITGQPIPEALIYGWTKMVHPEDLDRMLRQWYCSQIHTTPFRSEFRIYTVSGLYVPAISMGAPAFDSQGALTHWQGESIVRAEIPRRVINFSR